MSTIAVKEVQTPRRGGGHRIPSSLTERPDSRVYLANLPNHSATAGLVGYTPQLQELIRDALPITWYLIDKQGLGCDRVVHLFYANPKESLQVNSERLLELLEGLSMTDHIWVPVSTSHSMILHAFRNILPELKYLHLASVPMLYVGDNANRRSLKAMADMCKMPFYFHALY